MSSFDEEVTNFFKYYQDRGMKKWAGYFLSDHTLKLNQKKAQEAVVYQREEPMSPAAIGAVLMDSFANHYPVRIQLKELDPNGQPKPYLIGFVAGYDDQALIINRQRVALTDINHVKLLKAGA